MYAVLTLCQEMDIRLNEVTGKIDITWEPGMIGVLPVFSNKEDALIAYPKHKLVEIEFRDPEKKKKLTKNKK